MPIATVPYAWARTNTFNNGMTVYGGGGINASGNDISSFPIGLYEETTGGNQILPSTFRNTQLLAVGTPVGSTGGVKAATIFDYTNATTGAFTHTVGGVIAGYIGQALNVSLAAFGVVASGATSGAPITVALSGALQGDSVQMTPATIVLGQTAGIVLQAYATVNQVVVSAINLTAGPYDFSTAESGATPSKVRLEVTRGN
jgi:hypothetical protein